MNQDNSFTEQKIIIPSPQNMDDVTNIDKTKVFWTVILAVFVVGFVFILGYWIGQQKATTDYFKIMPNNSVDITPLTSDSTLPPSNQFPMQDPMNNNIPASNTDANDNLSALDGAVSGSTPSNITAIPQANNINNGIVSPLDSPVADPSTNITPPAQEPPSTVQIQQQPSSMDKKITIKPKDSLVRKAGIIPYYVDKNGSYALRLATVKSERNANDFKKKVQKLGYSNVNVAKIGVLYRISVLGFTNKKDAQSFQEIIKKQFKLTDTIVIKL